MDPQSEQAGSSPAIRLIDIAINTKRLDYKPSSELIYALEVAYALKRPLLLSGEAGTGKTEFANWVAAVLARDAGFHEEPLVFNTKSTSAAQDLFYYYDAIAHFRDSRIGANGDAEGKEAGKKGVEEKGPDEQDVEEKLVDEKQRSVADYIELRALGLAIQNAAGRDLLAGGKTETSARGEGGIVKGTVVLIDEIDKAPRDFPNDLLNELDRYEFEIREMGLRFELTDQQKKKIVVILTSNFEKNLPEAFLRRCIYFHIEFPKAGPLAEIVATRLGIGDSADLAKVKQRVEDFCRFRENENVEKKPATSECLDLIRVLQQEGNLDVSLLDNNKKVTSQGLRYLPIVLKKKEDRDLFIK